MTDWYCDVDVLTARNAVAKKVSEFIGPDKRLISWSLYGDLLRPDLDRLCDAVAKASGENEKALRLMLFYQHASPKHYLSGDDGELTCNTCFADFKRDSPALLVQKIREWNYEHSDTAAVQAVLDKAFPPKEPTP